MIRKKSTRPSGSRQRSLRSSIIKDRAQRSLLSTPERLVGLGFRSWMLGYQTGEISCWEDGWQLFAKELGSQNAKPVVTELACWARAINTTASRKIEVYPFKCHGFCHDECMAISLIAASQNDACPALKACAFALVGTDSVDDVITSAGAYGRTLEHHGLKLSSDAIVNAAASTTPTMATAYNH